jgi:hypothetical protein
MPVFLSFSPIPPFHTQFCSFVHCDEMIIVRVLVSFILGTQCIVYLIVLRVRLVCLLTLRKVCCSLDTAFGNYQIVDECARSPVIHINEDPVKRVNVLHTIRIRLCV